MAAALSYPLYLTLQLAGVGEIRFEKVVTRTLQCVAIIGLVPLMGRLGLNSKAGWGYNVRFSKFWTDLLAGLAFGIVSLSVIALTLFLLRVRVTDPDFEVNAVLVLGLLGEALLAGLLVALIEETWFRGALHSALRAISGPLVAVVATATLYSAVHFMRPEIEFLPVEVGWQSGFLAVIATFKAFAATVSIDSFLALVAVGVLLSLVRLRTGTLAQCIGVHAGWVLVIKVFRKVTDLDHTSQWAFLVGDYDGTIGYLALGYLLVLGLVYYWMYSDQLIRQ